MLAAGLRHIAKSRSGGGARFGPSGAPRWRGLCMKLARIDLTKHVLGLEGHELPLPQCYRAAGSACASEKGGMHGSAHRRCLRHAHKAYLCRERNTNVAKTVRPHKIQLVFTTPRHLREHTFACTTPQDGLSKRQAALVHGGALTNCLHDTRRRAARAVNEKHCSCARRRAGQHAGAQAQAARTSFPSTIVE